MVASGKTRGWRRLVLPLSILLLAVVVFAVLLATRPQTQQLEAREKAWPVAATRVELGSWPRTLTLHGRVDSINLTLLSAALSADVRGVHVIEGQSVRRGDLLLELDDRDYRLELSQREAEVAQARAAIEAEQSNHRGNLEMLPKEKRLLALAEAEVRRLAGLIEKKLASQSNLDTARQALARQSIAVSRIEVSVRSHESKMRELEARLAQKQAALEKARLQLARTRIEAPYDGRLTQVHVALGDRVNAGTALLELFEEESLIFRALVPEPYVADLQRQLEAGAAVEVSGRLGGSRLGGELISLSARIPAGSGGVEGLFRVTRGTGQLQLGRVVELQLRLPALPGVMPVPHEALYGGDRVYLLDDQDRLRPVSVERVGAFINEEGERKLLIRSPQLKPGDRLLLTQLPNVLEGLLVKVVDGG